VTSRPIRSTSGVRPDTDFFLWKITQRYEDLGELGAALNATPLGGWLETPFSYLATTKASEYTSARRARKIVPKGSPYLVVYPFVKVRPWYALPEADRQRAMDEHIRIGRDEFPTIHNHTTYSFGIDDQEFMTAFECDEPADFMHLMLRLRDSEASRYTERDTPIFVGQHMPIREALARLDGMASLVEDHR
jgi:chlorite dismutase